MGIGLDTKRFELKLRAIEKHAGALADELDAIDNGWTCECGSEEYKITYDNVRIDNQCMGCGKRFSLPVNEELPTRLEGSD